jgi:UDP-N-acetylmuramate dehydrogenase
VQQLLEAWQESVRNEQPVLILGEGSNVLFWKISGTVIINRIMGIETRKAPRLACTCWCGRKLASTRAIYLSHGMPGLENLALIPAVLVHRLSRISAHTALNCSAFAPMSTASS